MGTTATEVNLALIPVYGAWGKWQRIISRLSFEKALKIEDKSQKKLRKMRDSIMGSFRYSRHNDGMFKVKTRIVLTETGSYALYVWKEQNDDTDINQGV